MLGLMRFVLALFVVVTHLAAGNPFFFHWGVFAVFGFYIISGYLMTIILNEKYFFNLTAFAVNRFLRLFPIYYIVVIVSLIILIIIPNAKNFHSAWIFQYRIIDFLGNGFIVPFLFYNASFRIIPPSWSIAAELINYFLLWLVVARSYMLAILSLSIALLYHIVILAKGAKWNMVYFPFYAALLPFSLGATIYFLQRNYRLPNNVINYLLLLSIISWIVNLVFCGFVPQSSKLFLGFFYTNVIFFSIFVYAATSFPDGTRWIKYGKIFGDIAYPIFLTHWIVGFTVSELLYLKKGAMLFTVSLIPIFIISFMLSEFANYYIEPLRLHIRSNIKHDGSTKKIISEIP